jgi:hypothetical protein
MPYRSDTKRLTGPRARLLTSAALLSGALALAGCGGSSSLGVAHLSTSKSASSASPEGAGSSPASTASPEQAGVAFAKCMRSNGVPNFPDPKAGGGFLFHANTGMNPSSPAFKAAQAKCHKLMPGGGPPSTTNPSPQTLARFLKVARCMRAHGVSGFPDPRTSVPSNPFGSGSGTGVISDIEGAILIFPSTIDQQSPVFTRAAAACAFPLHNH